MAFLFNPIVAGALYAASRPNLNDMLQQRGMGTGLAQLLRQKYLSSVLLVNVVVGLSVWISGVLDGLYLRSKRARADKWDWVKEVAVVTGGSSGIGLETVKGLAKAGIKVAILDIQKPSCSLPPNVVFYQTNVREPAAIAETAGKVRKELGDPSILINNAGVSNAGNLVEGTPERVQMTIEVNLLSQFYTIREFLPDMIRRKHGHILGVASAASFVSIPTAADYCASKVGVLALHEVLRVELSTVHNAPSILTSIVHPSWVATPMTSKGMFKSTESFLSPEKVGGAIVKQVLSCKGENVHLPNPVRYASLLRTLPIWLQDPLRILIAKDLQRKAL